MNNNALKLYLSGAISCHYNNNEYHKATEWRIKLIQKLLDRIADKCSGYYDWFDPTLNFEDNIKTANARTVVHQNNYYLDRCDILIVNLEDLDKSLGTMYELFYYGIHDKPVIAFGEDTGNLLNSPHVSECITVKLNNIDEVVEYLDNYYYQ